MNPKLTPKEIEIVSLLALGMNSRALAEALNISRGTADTHCANIREKLCVNSRAAAVAAAIKEGYLNDSGEIIPKTV